MPLRSGSVSYDPLDPVNYNRHASILTLCTGLARRITIFLNTEPDTLLLRAVQEQTRVALGVLDTALERFSPEEVSLSYQGKQEDLVLLNLLLCALARLRTPLPTALQTIYVASPGAVTDVDAFVSESVAMYRLDLARYDVPANDALKGYLGERPKVKAILAGTTRTDPHGQTLTHFDETGEGLPSVTQVHPIIDWDQAEISAFIQHFGIPHSSLYAQTKSPGTSDHDLEYGSPIY